MTANTRQKCDSSMSASGDYREPSMSSVVLPDPPSWVNLEEILPYDERQRIKDVIERGRELLPDLAEFGRMAKAALETIDAPGVPGVVFEVEEIRECLGIAALTEVMSLLGVFGGDPAGTPGDAMLAKLAEQYPEYADLLDEL